MRTGLLGLLLGCGVACSSVRTGQPTPQTATPPALESAAAASERITTSASRGREAAQGSTPSPKRLQKWNPIWWFGNVDDPEPPDWYRPGSRHRRWLWQLRNPLHNFTFYVIGVADRAFTRTGRHPEHVFAPDGGWNWAVTRLGWVRLPFVSFNGERCRFYLGWRERGNFGGKINIGRLPAKPAEPSTPPGSP
jgi:hypothetical protein